MSFLGNSMPLPITSDGKQCGSSGSAYIECTKVDGKQFYNITSSHFRAINISTWRKSGLASNPLFRIPGFSLHFP